jgi:hypothetical protein
VERIGALQTHQRVGVGQLQRLFAQVGNHYVARGPTLPPSGGRGGAAQSIGEGLGELRDGLPPMVPGHEQMFLQRGDRRGGCVVVELDVDLVPADRRRGPGRYSADQVVSDLGERGAGRGLQQGAVPGRAQCRDLRDVAASGERPHEFEQFERWVLQPDRVPVTGDLDVGTRAFVGRQQECPVRRIVAAAVPQRHTVAEQVEIGGVEVDAVEVHIGAATGVPAGRRPVLVLGSDGVVDALDRLSVRHASTVLRHARSRFGRRTRNGGHSVPHGRNGRAAERVPGPGRTRGVGRGAERLCP